MKKIILVLAILLLTGCFEDSGTLTKTCIKEETANTLSINTVYTFTFKQDIISDLKVSYQYNDTDTNTISSIKLSYKSQNASLNDINYNILSDTDNEYKIEYILPLEKSVELKDKFVIKTKRSELVKELKEQDFTCN